MKPIQDLYSLLNNPSKIVVTMHQKPDPDAMGSALGLYHVLIQMGHWVTVISPTNWADFMDWMPGAEKVLDYERFTEAADLALENAQIIFCLDFNTLSRTKRMAGKLAEVNAMRVLIDHHQMPETTSFHFGISDVSKSSTCEMIYDFIIDSGLSDKINEPFMQCIYAGVMTDTGSFRFPSTTPGVHRLVADLMERGLRQSVIHEQIFDHYLENRLRFFGFIFMHRMEVFYDHNTVLITASQADLQRFDIRTGDTEGLVNFPLSIRGIKMAVLIFDRGEEVKLSFRSKGDFDVNNFARKYFNGGGHKNASGAGSKLSLDETVEVFIRAMKENQLQLQ